MLSGETGCVDIAARVWYSQVTPVCGIVHATAIKLKRGNLWNSLLSQRGIRSKTSAQYIGRIERVLIAKPYLAKHNNW